MIDAKECVEAGVQFWTNPSGAVLTSDIIPPVCVTSVATLFSAQLWTSMTNHQWLANRDPETIEEGSGSNAGSPIADAPWLGRERT